MNLLLGFAAAGIYAFFIISAVLPFGADHYTF